MIGNAFWKFVIEAIGEEMFTSLMQQFMSKVRGMVTEKVKKRVETILGSNVEQAKKDITDEIIYSMVVAALDDDKADEIDAFEARLRLANNGMDKEKAEAFILFVATVVTKFQREVKQTTNPKKGESGPASSATFTDYTEGINLAKKILESLLRVTGSTEDNTFNKRVAFLEGKNVFSLMKAKKGTSEFEKLWQKAKTSASSFLNEKSDVVEALVLKLEKEAAESCDDAVCVSKRKRFLLSLKEFFIN